MLELRGSSSMGNSRAAAVLVCAVVHAPFCTLEGSCLGASHSTKLLRVTPSTVLLWHGHTASIDKGGENTQQLGPSRN